MADVFISYHEKSAGELAGQIADKLDAAGISAWCARRDLPPGENFAQNIPTQIHNCRLFLLILTESAYQSKHVLNEVGIAFSRYNKGENVTILPIEIGNFTRKDWVEYYLIHTQSVKIPQPDTQRVENLIKQIARALSVPLRTAQPMPIPQLPPTPPLKVKSRANVIKSGLTGDCTWTLDSNHVLTVSGFGKMGDFDHSSQLYSRNVKVAVIEHGVTSIGGSAFRDCTGLISVTIPNSVISIGGGAFENCTGLTSVTIPNSVTYIGGSAFYFCKALTSVTIPNSVTSIGNRAFNICSGLTSVTISNRVILIERYTFSGCSRLTGVQIPDSVTSISDSAFAGCINLTSVKIPDSVTSIEDDAFYSCNSLKQVSVSKKTNVFPKAFPPHTQIIRR